VGFKVEKINDKEDIGNRPFYYSEIYVDHKMKIRVYSVFTMSCFWDAAKTLAN